MRRQQQHVAAHVELVSLKKLLHQHVEQESLKRLLHQPVVQQYLKISLHQHVAVHVELVSLNKTIEKAGRDFRTGGRIDEPVFCIPVAYNRRM